MSVSGKARDLITEGTKDDIATGTTPRKRQWEYADHWQLTKGREEVLREWRSNPIGTRPRQAQNLYQASIETVPEVLDVEVGSMEPERMVTDPPSPRTEPTGQENLPVQRLTSPTSSPHSTSASTAPTESTAETSASVHELPPVLAPTQPTTRPTHIRHRTASVTTGLPKATTKGGRTSGIPQSNAPAVERPPSIAATRPRRLRS